VESRKWFLNKYSKPKIYKLRTSLKPMTLSEKEFFRNEIKEIVFYIIFIVFFAILLPLTIGFGFEQFSDSFKAGSVLKVGDLLTNYLIYYIMIVGALMLIAFPIASLVTIRKGEHPATQQPVSWFRIFTVSFIHNPENGLLYQMFDYLGFKGKINPMRWSLSILRVFIIAILIFMALGIVQTINPAFNVVDIPQSIQQQVTPLGQLIFTAEPASSGETMTMMFVFFLLLGISVYISAKFKLGKLGFYTLGIFDCVLIAFAWMGFHRIVYGASDIALQATFIFGLVGSLLTLLFGTFLFWWAWHFNNNFFAKLSEIAPGNADVIFISIVSWIGLLIVWISFEVLLFKFKRRLSGSPPDDSF